MLTTKNRVGSNRVVILLTSLAVLAGCTPPGPRALLEGKRLMDQGKYAQAVEELRIATTLLSTNAQAGAQAWNYLGLARHHLGEADAAASAYQRALALDHNLSEVHYNLGCLWLEQNKLENAKAELTAYTLHRGNSVEGFVKLATAQARSRDFSAAEKSLDAALRLSANNPEALNELGLLRLQQRRPAEAAQCFDRALKVEPKHAAALLNSAIVYHQYLKELPLALQKYRACLALKPPPANAEALAATVRELELELHPPARPTPPAKVAQVVTHTNLPKPAATNVTRVVSLPKPAATNVTRVASLSKAAPATNVPKPLPLAVAPRPAPTNAPAPAPAVTVVKLPTEPAIRPAQDVSTKPPSVPPSPAAPLAATSAAPAGVTAPKPPQRGFFESVNPLKVFRSEEKQSPRLTPLPSSTASNVAVRPAPAPVAAPSAAAVAFSHYNYQSPVKPQPGNRPAAEPWFAQGLQAQQARRLADAVQAYRQATQLDPAFFEAQYNLGLAATEAGNLATALRAYEYTLAIQPNSADARYNFALVLKQANCPADAANELEILLAVHPNEARAHLALGNLYAQALRQPAQARQHYLKVLELDPACPQASAVGYWLKDHPQ